MRELQKGKFYFSRQVISDIVISEKLFCYMFTNLSFSNSVQFQIYTSQACDLITCKFYFTINITC